MRIINFVTSRIHGVFGYGLAAIISLLWPNMADELVYNTLKEQKYNRDKDILEKNQKKVIREVLNKYNLSSSAELSVQESRLQKLQIMSEAFYMVSEDPIDGTVFDCDILDCFDALKAKYSADNTRAHLIDYMPNYETASVNRQSIVDALKFYASESQYSGTWHPENIIPVMVDRGAIAKAALKKI